MEIPSYSLTKLEEDIQKIKPRAFDTWILPGFIMLYAYKSNKVMSKKVRRILFISGVYMAYRNYSNYKGAVGNALAYVKTLRAETLPAETLPATSLQQESSTETV